MLLQSPRGGGQGTPSSALPGGPRSHLGLRGRQLFCSQKAPHPRRPSGHTGWWHAQALQGESPGLNCCGQGLARLPAALWASPNRAEGGRGYPGERPVSPAETPNSVGPKTPPGRGPLPWSPLPPPLGSRCCPVRTCWQPRGSAGQTSHRRPICLPAGVGAGANLISGSLCFPATPPPQTPLPSVVSPWCGHSQPCGGRPRALGAPPQGGVECLEGLAHLVAPRPLTLCSLRPQQSFFAPQTRPLPGRVRC